MLSRAWQRLPSFPRGSRSLFVSGQWAVQNNIPHNLRLPPTVDGKSFLSSAGIVAFTTVAIGLAADLKNEKNEQEESERNVAFSPSEFREFTLSNVKDISPDTKILRFELEDPNQSVGMGTASCIVVKTDQSTAVRPYTPISSNEDKGHFELLIKKYNQGALTPVLHDLRLGSKISVKGPFEKFPYSCNNHKHINMIAGGTGITPMLQVITEIFRNKNDTTTVTLLFANKTKEDILLKEHLDRLSKLFPNRFKVVYTLDSPPANWDGKEGFVTKEMLEEVFPERDDDSMVLLCGPPPMVGHLAGPKAKDKSQGPIGGLLKSMGYKEHNVFKF